MNLKKIILIILGVGVFLLLVTGILMYFVISYYDSDFYGDPGPDPGVIEKSFEESKKLSISSQIQLERGSEIVENVGIVNIESTEKVFGINVEYVKKQNPDNSTAVAPEGADEISFFYSDAIDKTLAPDAGEVIPIQISAKSSAAGTYLYKVNVLTETVPGACAQGLETPGCELYATKSFFVSVS